MSELMSALDALAAKDLTSFTDREKLDRSTGLAVAINRLQAEFARTVRSAEVTQSCEDDGMKTMQSWLRGHCRLSPVEAFRVVRRGRTLEELSAVAAGFADGMITAEPVTVAAAVARPEHVTAAAAQDVDLTGIDAVLAEVAMTRPYADLGQVVHHYLARLNPDGPEPDPTEGRRLSMHTGSDGTVTGAFQLDPLGGEKVQAALEAIARADRPEGDVRCRSQQLADALVQLAEIALGFGKLPMHRGSKPHVIVTIGASDLFDPAVGHGAARLGFGSWFCAQQTRQVTCDGQLTPILIDEHGIPLSVGRTQRLVSPQLRRPVVLRDEHCVFAGCTAPHFWCDVHQVWRYVSVSATARAGPLRRLSSPRRPGRAVTR